MAFQLDRALVIDENFLKHIQEEVFPEPRSLTSLKSAGLSPALFLQWFQAQIQSRHLDLIARILKQKNLGYYTIGSSGHEGNAAIAGVFRVDDPALLHYRSGAFYLARAQKAHVDQGLYYQLLSLVASKSDPISSGRHKVFGSVELAIPPQTSTIASHLPRAVGLAVALVKAKELNIVSQFPLDAVVLCSFGDASTHHSTAQGAFNSARYYAYQHYPLPLVFVCEDNNIGISVPTPPNWLENQFQGHSGLHYLACDGLNLADVYHKALEAEYFARVKKIPVFLHMKTVRLMGHAGSDVETHYLSEQWIIEQEFQDPLLHSARIALNEGILTKSEIIALYEESRKEIQRLSERALQEPKLTCREEIMAAIIPPAKKILAELGALLPSTEQRQAVFKETFTQLSQPKHLAVLINYALTDLMIQYKSIVVFGEDVAKKGGVYRVTSDLMTRFGQKRVFNAILDEQTILGHALGFALNGLCPIPEIQFLAYIHNAIDQIRGEAATQSFFSSGQYTNPMVIRIAGLAYQKGFGGHFHNDNSITALRDIPGIIIACPSRGDDAAKMLRTCVELAIVQQQVVIFLEPIALYMTKDLHHANDQQWLCVYPSLDQKIALGEINTVGDEQAKITIISYANGYYLSRQAQQILKEQHHIDCKVIDIRWLKPLPIEAILKEIQFSHYVLIVDEGRKTGSVSEELFTLLLEHLPERAFTSFHHPSLYVNAKISEQQNCKIEEGEDISSGLPQVPSSSISPLIYMERITGEDSFIPLGKAWECLLPSCETIVNKVLHSRSII